MIQWNCDGVSIFLNTYYYIFSRKWRIIYQDSIKYFHHLNSEWIYEYNDFQKNSNNIVKVAWKRHLISNGPWGNANAQLLHKLCLEAEPPLLFYVRTKYIYFVFQLKARKLFISPAHIGSPEVTTNYQWKPVFVMGVSWSDE